MEDMTRKYLAAKEASDELSSAENDMINFKTQLEKKYGKELNNAEIFNLYFFKHDEVALAFLRLRFGGIQKKRKDFDAKYMELDLEFKRNNFSLKKNEC